ncbi:MAG: type II secretion system protein [Candidatus Omnitrophota bacterium]|jgi:type II secretory pathway pseudopilin PulG
MCFGNRKAVTLVESLVSLTLLTALISCVFGSFYISKLSAARATHKVVAMNLARQYMEKEISKGYNSGSYCTFTSSAPVIWTDPADGVKYSIAPSPIVAPDLGTVSSTEGTNYKIIGFVVTCYAPSGGVESTERVVTCIADGHV